MKDRHCTVVGEANKIVSTKITAKICAPPIAHHRLSERANKYRAQRVLMGFVRIGLVALP